MRGSWRQARGKSDWAVISEKGGGTHRKPKRTAPEFHATRLLTAPDGTLLTLPIQGNFEVLPEIVLTEIGVTLNRKAFWLWGRRLTGSRRRWKGWSKLLCEIGVEEYLFSYAWPHSLQLYQENITLLQNTWNKEEENKAISFFSNQLIEAKKSLVNRQKRWVR